MSATSRAPRKKKSATTPVDLWPAATSERNGRGSAERGVSQQPQLIDSNGRGSAQPGASQQPQHRDWTGGSKEGVGTVGSQQEPAGDKGEGTLLQPWSDHHGRLNEPFLRSLTQRAVSIVIRHPGEHPHLDCNQSKLYAAEKVLLSRS